MMLHVYGEHETEVLKILALAESEPSVHNWRQMSVGPQYRLDIEVGVNGLPRLVREEGKEILPLPDVGEIRNAWRLDMDYCPWQPGSCLQVFARWKTANPYFLVFDLVRSGKKGDEDVPFHTHSILEAICRSGENPYLRLPKGVDAALQEALKVQLQEPFYHFDRVFVMSGVPALHQLKPDIAESWFQNAMRWAAVLLEDIRRTTEKLCHFDDKGYLDEVLLKLFGSTSLGRLLASLDVS